MGSVHRSKPTKAAPDGQWRVCYRSPDGRQRTKTFKTQKEAKQYLARVEVAMSNQEWRDPQGGRTTFGQWTEMYFAGALHKRPTTMARDVDVTRRHYLPTLGKRPLGSITPLDVRRLVEQMAGHLAPSTVRTNYGVLRAIMAAAVDAELITRSPCRKIPLPADNRDQPRFLAADELGRLAAALPVTYRPVIYVAGVCGLRWSEVAGLRVGRIDFLRRTLTVAETVAEVSGHLMWMPTKTKAANRTLPVPPFLVAMLSEHLARTGRRDPDDLVFTAPDGGPLRATNWRRRVWAPAIASAGLPGLTFHGLRHTAAGFMIALGAHPRVLQKRLGHASSRTSMDVYGAVLPSVDAALTNGLEKLFTTPPPADEGAAEQ